MGGGIKGYMRSRHLFGQYKIRSGMNVLWERPFCQGPGGRYPGVPQLVEVAPFSPSPARQKKMPQAIFCSGQAATLEKKAAAGGLKMINLTPVVALDNFAIPNFGQQIS